MQIPSHTAFLWFPTYCEQPLFSTTILSKNLFFHSFLSCLLDNSIADIMKNNLFAFNNRDTLYTMSFTHSPHILHMSHDQKKRGAIRVYMQCCAACRHRTHCPVVQMPAATLAEQWKEKRETDAQMDNMTFAAWFGYKLSMTKYYWAKL